MKRLFHRILCHAQLCGNLSLCSQSPFADKKFLLPIEQHRVARRSVLRLQPNEHLLQHCQRPVPLVKPVCAPGLRQLKIGDLRLEQFVQRDMWTALVPLNATGAMPLGREETFERHEQVRTQTSLLAPDHVQISVFEQTREKFLDQILRFFSSKALSPNESVERSPIGTAKYLECFLRSGRFALRLQYY